MQDLYPSAGTVVNKRQTLVCHKGQRHRRSVPVSGEKLPWELRPKPLTRKVHDIFTEMMISLNLSNLLVISVTRNQSSAVYRNICAVVSILTPWGWGVKLQNQSQSVQFHNFLGGKIPGLTCNNSFGT